MMAVVENCRASRFIYGIFTNSIVFTILFGWLVYGNIMFFSQKNDCIKMKETRVLAYVMQAYLYLGYI